jgi:adenylosuccinate lyase
VDAQAQATLAGIAQSAHKFANDLRLLQHLREVQEPFEDEQVGSSAMAYKRNPMKSERMTSLARLVLSLWTNSAFTAASQWFERTLDDSANKRLSVPEAFLTADAILSLVIDVAEGLRVYPKVILNNLRQELPFLLTEDLMMAAAKGGGDRQALHERIRQHAVAAAAVVREEGKPNDLVDRLKADPAFSRLSLDWAALMDPARYVGRAPEQVERFLADEVDPALRGIPEPIAEDLAVSV